ncbi:MAG: hypothetical protein DMF63_10455 [Acidobacteria bacterium]|nr:MAG: hypothetical protein DMF63_10455 [Acidobacteriota bacterium]
MWAKTLKIAVPFIWFGMVLAISFMEAPLKFQAAGITIPLGLGIGQLVFFALNKMEIVCAFLLLIACWRSGRSPKAEKIFLVMALLILILETVWLLPVLDARAIEVIAGTAPPFSRMHFVYIGFDALKLVMLLMLGIASTRNYLRTAVSQ